MHCIRAGIQTARMVNCVRTGGWSLLNQIEESNSVAIAEACVMLAMGYVKDALA